MGRGNVCVTGSYEGLFYIDNDDLRVYRRNDPTPKRRKPAYSATSVTKTFRAMNGFLMRSGAVTRKKTFSNASVPNCGSSAPAFSLRPTRTSGSAMSVGSSLENELFYICVEDNAWSLAVELVQKDSYSDCENAWLSGLQRTKYKRYLECMKTALLTRLPEIGTYAGAWTSGRITREENENETAQMS